MKLDREYVKHLAKLARLELTEEEAEKFSKQLSEILSFFEQISSLNLEKVEPTFHVKELKSVLREDNPATPADRELILLNAPDKERGYFKTNRVVS